MAETSLAAAGDVEVILLRKDRAKKANVHKLQDVFQELDESGDGIVTIEEFQALMDDDVMMQFLGTMELEVGDLEELFQLLDDGTGQVQSSDFIAGVERVKGQAKNIDVMLLLKMMRDLSGEVEKLAKRGTCADG
eukprot:UN0137